MVLKTKLTHSHPSPRQEVCEGAEAGSGGHQPDVLQVHGQSAGGHPEPQAAALGQRQRPAAAGTGHREAEDGDRTGKQNKYGALEMGC